jgi:hypothetical protein
MGSFFFIGVTNRRFAPSNTFLAIRKSYYVSIFIPKSKTDIYRDGKTVVISRMDSNLYPVKKIRKVFIVVGKL